MRYWPIGIKVKREAFNKPGQAYTVGPPFLKLDEVASNRNHYFVEVPLLLQFNLPHLELGLRAGVNYRSFLANTKAVDFLTGRFTYPQSIFSHPVGTISLQYI